MFKKVKSYCSMISLAVCMVLAAPAAYALPAPGAPAGGALSAAKGQTIGQIAGNVTASMQGVSVALQAFCYLAALVMLITGILKFKAHKDDPRSTPLSTPIVIWVCAILFAFAPMVLSSGGSTLFGVTATGVNATGTAPW